MPLVLAAFDVVWARLVVWAECALSATETEMALKLEYCRSALSLYLWSSELTLEPSSTGLAQQLRDFRAQLAVLRRRRCALGNPIILAPLASATYTAELEKEMELFNVCTGEQKARHICPIISFWFLIFKSIVFSPFSNSHLWPL